VSSHEDTKTPRWGKRHAAMIALIFAAYILYWNAFNQGADTALCVVDLASTDDVDAVKAKPYCRNAARSWAVRLDLKNAEEIMILCAFVSSCELIK
jgi:hypothetical protein